MQTDIIFLDHIRLSVRIGTTEEERLSPQDIVVSVRVGASLGAAGRSDDLSRSVDYSLVESEIRRIAESSNFHLVESLAQALAEQILKIPATLFAWVRIEKRVLKSVECVGVEIWRDRS